MKIVTAVASAAVLLAWSAPSMAQESGDELKDRILKKVEEQLRADRERILDSVRQIIEDELKRLPAAPPAANPELEKLVREMEDLRGRLDKTLARAKELLGPKAGAPPTARRPEPAPTPKAPEADPPAAPDEQALQEEFQKALEALQAKKFDEAIRGFQSIAKQAPDQPIGYVSLYNSACAFALQGKLDEAFQNLEHAIRQGFNDADHMQSDADLEDLRKDGRWEKMMKLARSKGT